MLKSVEDHSDTLFNQNIRHHIIFFSPHKEMFFPVWFPRTLHRTLILISIQSNSFGKKPSLHLSASELDLSDSLMAEYEQIPAARFQHLVHSLENRRVKAVVSSD